MISVLYLISVLAIGLVSIYFVFHREYEDCVLGRFGLAVMSLSAFAVAHDTLEGWTITPLPTTLSLIGGMAVYMLWLLYRFERRRRLGWKPDHIKA